MADTITIHFKGICTHLVNGSRQPGLPADKKVLGLKPIHKDQQPTYRVVLPRWDALPDDLKQKAAPINPGKIPEHFAKLRYKNDDVTPPANWERKKVGDYWEHDLNGCAIWFNNILKDKAVTPPAQALHGLPSIWTNTKNAKNPMPPPDLDIEAVNDMNSKKIAAFVDLFGGTVLTIDDDDPKFPNQVKMVFELRDGDTPLLVCNKIGGAPFEAKIRRNGTIQISNSAIEQATCCPIDYLLQYLVTKLDLLKSRPIWPDPPKPPDSGTDTPYCSSGTYP